MTCLRECIVTLVALVWLFSTVRLQMRPQIFWKRRCIVALVTFVWLFSTMHFQMSPQSACKPGRIIALVAFVWFFSTVRSQMCPQIACMGRCIVTLVAFMWLNDIVSIFHQVFHICILQTKVIILFHCHCVLYFSQMVASNWVKCMIDFWSRIASVNYTMGYFHFLSPRGPLVTPLSMCGSTWPC